MRLENKIALVTGGAGGLGGATATRMAEEGATVYLTDVADGIDLAKEIDATYIRQDVTDEDQWEEIAGTILDKHGRLDALVNAAGVEGHTEGSPLGSYDNWKRVIAINLDGTFLGCRAFLPSMLKRGEGSIVNFASMTTFVASPASAAYGASKAGIWQLCKSIAAFAGEAGTNVRCNSIHPGIVRTPMVEQICEIAGREVGISGKEVEESMTRVIPLGYLGDPLDVAHMVVFLTSDESRYVTGSDFKVDGGWNINSPKLFG